RGGCVGVRVGVGRGDDDVVEAQAHPVTQVVADALDEVPRGGRAPCAPRERLDAQAEAEHLLELGRLLGSEPRAAQQARLDEVLLLERKLPPELVRNLRELTEQRVAPRDVVGGKPLDEDPVAHVRGLLGRGRVATARVDRGVELAHAPAQRPPRALGVVVVLVLAHRPSLALRLDSSHSSITGVHTVGPSPSARRSARHEGPSGTSRSMNEPSASESIASREPGWYSSTRYCAGGATQPSTHIVPVGLSDRLIITVTGSHAKVIVPVRTISRSSASCARAASSGVSTCSSSTISARSCSTVTAKSDISVRPSGTGSTVRNTRAMSASKDSSSKFSRMARPPLVAREQGPQLLESPAPRRPDRGHAHPGRLGDEPVARTVREGHDTQDLLAPLGKRLHVAPQRAVALRGEHLVLRAGLKAHGLGLGQLGRT